MALARMGATDAGGPLSLAQAVDRIQSAIDQGKLTAQYAPAGDPIFAAIANAESVRDEIKVMIPWFSDGTTGPTIGPDTGRTWQELQDAINGITTAAANVKVNPDAPLPTTNWMAILGGTSLPWPYVAGGAAALVAAAVLFQRHRSRRRRRRR